VLDRRLIAETKDAVERGKHVRLDLSIRNFDRSTGAMLSGVIAKRYGHAGLRDEAIHIKFKGTAGQSFGAGDAFVIRLNCTSAEIKLHFGYRTFNNL